MNWNQVSFEAAFGTIDQILPSDLPEICFSGRSNVGKSSLINKLLNRKSLARVSSTPGKTVTVNFYKMNTVRLVDLPGYGYAKVPFSEKSRWSDLMEGYFRSERNIRLVLQLIDMRHPPSDFDTGMLEFLLHMQIPFAVVLTKADKLNKSEFENRILSIRKELSSVINESTPILPFSALKGTGVTELRALIEKVCE